MRLDRVLADIELPGDLAIAHALRYQFEDFKLAARDAEVLSFPLVRGKWFPGRDADFLYNDPLPRPCQLEAEPNSRDGKRGRDQSAVDFDRMFDYQEPIFRPLQHGYQDSTD